MEISDCLLDKDEDKTNFTSSYNQGKSFPESGRPWSRDREALDPRPTENWVKRSSHASDTSSAYSGSDVMQSSADDDLDADSPGLPESDGEEGLSESLIVRDRVRECLEKDPASRTERDIEILLEFVQHMPAFSNMTLVVRGSLCSVMTFAVVPKGDTAIYGDGQEVDAWSVIVNGHVEVLRPDGTIEHLHMGDSFGVTSVDDKLLHCGTMRTKVDDCQMVQVNQRDYHRILNQGNQSVSRVEERGELVLVVEKRNKEDGKEGQVILRGTPEKLILQLIENNATDHRFIEDFLLTYRTFIKSPLDVTRKLLLWLQDPAKREKAARVVMLWVNSHFRDFESSPDMMEFLEKFEVVLEEQKMSGQLRLLSMAYEARARSRLVVLSRSTREEILFFTIVGGLEKKSGIFIAKVERGSKAFEAGLMRGDQILEVNKHDFERVHHSRALEILCGNTQLAITVKSNLRAFRKVIQLTENSNRPSKTTADGATERLSTDAEDLMASLARLDLKDDRSCRNRATSVVKCVNGKSATGKSVGRKTSSVSEDFLPRDPLSWSSPDLSNIHGTICPAYSLPDQVVKVYRADQTFKYLIILKETTAREVVMLALTEFGIADPSCQYSLNEVTIDEFVKSRHLPDQLTNLCERIHVNSRYYIRDMKSMELLVLDDQVESIKREVQTNFLDLDPGELAVELTRSDLKQFKDIEETEYIEDLFGIESEAGCRHLIQFIQLVNREMFWVVTEVCSEPSVIKRAKIIKQFIKLARFCKMTRNFNSMFAVLSGLGHAAVSRLRLTWDKVPPKYTKLFEEMQCLMDPSRNMSKYRNMLNAHIARPPVIPFFPLVKKDLAFIHYGNDSRVEGLVNFDKLRMIAKEVHQMSNLASGILPNSLACCRNSAGEHANLSSSAVATMKRKKSTATALNLKKMYEDMLMSRKARTYLLTLKVNEDEGQLAKLSALCEMTVRPAVRKVSSSESLAFSSPSTESLPFNPMFGTGSQKDVRKLMTLTNKVRPVDPKRSTTHRIRSVPSSPVHTPKKLHSILPLPLPLPAVDLSRESSSVTGINFKHRLSKGKGRFAANLPLTAAVSKMLDSDSGFGSTTSSDTQNADSGAFAALRPLQDKRHLQLHSTRPWSTGDPLAVESHRTAGHQDRRQNQNQYNSVAGHFATIGRFSNRRPLRPPTYEDAIQYSALGSTCGGPGHPALPSRLARVPLPPHFAGSLSTTALMAEEKNARPVVRLVRERSCSCDELVNPTKVKDGYDEEEDEDEDAFDLSDENSNDGELVSVV